jgi:hypothetical protein
MTTYLPDRRPAGADDAAVARLALRTSGDSGFLFVNNYVHNFPLPERCGFQVQVKLPSKTLTVPEKPVDVPADSYFIWPLNLDLGAGTLEYSTAQLLSRFDANGETTYFFFAVPGIAPEFAFDASSIFSVQSSSGTVRRAGHCILLDHMIPGKDSVVKVAGKNGHAVRLIVLTEQQAENFWQLQIGDKQTALLSPADVFAGPDGIHLRSVVRSNIEASVFVASGKSQQLWRERTWNIEPRQVKYEWTSLRQPGQRNSIPTDNAGKRDKPMPLAPQDSDFSQAAAWTLTIPTQSMAGLSDIYVRFQYAGDVARLYLDGDLLDDNFYDGQPWEIGLKRFLPAAFDQKLVFDVLPMPRNDLIYLDLSAWAKMNPAGQTAKVDALEILPEYEVVMASEARRKE